MGDLQRVGLSQLGSPGFSIPRFSQADAILDEVLYNWSDIALPERGVGNRVFIAGKKDQDVRFQLNGSKNNSVYLHNAENIHGKISVTGSENIVIVGGNSPWQSRLNINVNGDRCVCFIGTGCTFVDARFFINGDNCNILCGDDCMFSHSTMVRTYDQHCIVDLQSGEWVNKPESVIIGPHVWVGQETLILKASTIGRGCIIGSRSTVTSNVEDCCVAVGSPARVVRRDVSWSRNLMPDNKTVEEVRELVGYVRA